MMLWIEDKIIILLLDLILDSYNIYSTDKITAQTIRHKNKNKYCIWNVKK